jgi:hypothetical protein
MSASRVVTTAEDERHTNIVMIVLRLRNEPLHQNYSELTFIRLFTHGTDRRGVISALLPTGVRVGVTGVTPKRIRGIIVSVACALGH